MGCNYGSIKCIGESYRYYILGTVVKKSRSCIYLALRSLSTQRGVNFETNCPVTTCNDYVNLTPNESQHLDELCSSGVLCILKRVEKDANNVQLLNEKHALEELRGNKTILHMFESFSYEGSFYISTEYLWRDSLYNYISYHGKLDLSLVKSISYKVLMIIETIHKHGWVHRDITSLNLMIDQSGNIKLIDFEFAKRIETGQKMTSFLGTEYSIPPEVYTHNPYGKEVDFWYLGIVIFEMLTGHPSPSCSTSHTKSSAEHREITQYRSKFLNTALLYRSVPFGLPEGNDDFGQRLISSPGSIDFGIVKDVDVIDLLKGLLDSEPSKRLGYRGIDEIKSHPFFKDAERPRADIEVNFIQTRILNMFKALIEEDECVLDSKQSHIEKDATEIF